MSRRTNPAGNLAVDPSAELPRQRDGLLICGVVCGVLFLGAFGFFLVIQARGWPDPSAGAAPEEESETARDSVSLSETQTDIVDPNWAYYEETAPARPLHVVERDIDPGTPDGTWQRLAEQVNSLALSDAAAVSPGTSTPPNGARDGSAKAAMLEGLYDRQFRDDVRLEENREPRELEKSRR